MVARVLAASLITLLMFAVPVAAVEPREPLGHNTRWITDADGSGRDRVSAERLERLALDCERASQPALRRSQLAEIWLCA